jgi:hypothetical protein
LNGNAKIPDANGLREAASKHMVELLTTSSGVIEIDGKDIKEGRPEEEIFRFDGALDIIGHIMNIYLRRLYKSNSIESKFMF